MSLLTNKNSRTYLSKPLIKILLLCALALSFLLIMMPAPVVPAPEVTHQISMIVSSLPGQPGYEDEPYTLFADGVVIQEDLTDADGVIRFDHIPGTQTYVVELVNGHRFEIQPIDSAEAASVSQQLARQGRRAYQAEVEQLKPLESSDDYRALGAPNDHALP